MKRTILSIAALLFGGCIMVDSKVSDIRPAATGPDSFGGLFRNLASYRSQSITGLYQPEYLQEYFDCFTYPDRAEEVRIAIDRDLLTADIRFADGRVEKRKLTLGRDCMFKEGYLIFPRKREPREARTHRLSAS